MGEYFHYANLDRRELFDVGLGVYNDKRSGIGRNLGARALGLLLKEQAPAGGLPGSWAGQRVMVVGDETPNGLYETARADYRDIASAVLLMLFADDREEIIEAAVTNDSLFVHLAELAVVHGADTVAGALAAHFGAEWRKKYGLLRKQMHYLVIPPP
ncbi:MAG TPA: hypothetical protein VIF57_02685 [Polyangia bacterium]